MLKNFESKGAIVYIVYVCSFVARLPVFHPSKQSAEQLQRKCSKRKDVNADWSEEDCLIYLIRSFKIVCALGIMYEAILNNMPEEQHVKHGLQNSKKALGQDQILPQIED